MTHTRTDITAWQWRLASTNDHGEAVSVLDKTPFLSQWADVASFPSIVQMELQATGVIHDVNIGENERLTQWAGHADWEYQAVFTASPEAGDEVDLVFEGLDTFATVTLNGTVILSSDNMFLPQRVSVKDVIHKGGKTNTVHILFESPYKRGAALEDQYGVRPALFRDARRNHIRKAQYHWGWDWGPIVVTAGPYLPVYLDTYKHRIDSVYVRTTSLFADHTSATVAVTVSVVGDGSEETANVRVVDPAGKELAQSTVTFSSNLQSATATFDLKDPQLWWPNGQGEQHLHVLEVTLGGNGSQDTHTTRFGVRTITVQQEPLADGEPGSTFMVRVNDRDIFAQGGNWIPADTLLPTITRQRYFDWVQNARDAHMNMLRVWGGGIYESDDFFDACDELGLLVWHDYGFACTNLPVHGSFLKSFTKEAEAQTMRLRSRASLAILCGGNEDFMLLDWEKVAYDHSDVRGPYPAGGAFPQRTIYLDILPKLAARLCPETFYWANSPWSPGGLDANDLTRGDVHQWDVWHGNQKPYQEYKQLAGRFVSEFGMHGFPVQRTIDYFAPRTGQKGEGRHAQSRLIDCHNKGHGAHTRIARYLAENVRYDTSTLANFAYASQLMQAEAYQYALRDWKRMFGGRSPSGVSKARCAGSIIWQLNDDYPCTSWSLVDYFVRPKPAWYMVRRLYAPISVASERTPGSRFVDEDNPLAASAPPSFALFAHNTAASAAELTLSLQAYDFWADAWSQLPAADADRKVTLLPGQNNELGTLAAQPSWNKDSLIILELSLKDAKGNVVARYVDWPEPYRYLEWPNDTKLDVKVAHVKDAKDGKNKGQVDAHVTVVANQPLKGVWLEPVYDGKEAHDSFEPRWEDNMFDLMPGQAITVGVSGLNGREVKARFLADWEVGK
ncbi:beta-mannosidase [Sporothrix schenckii 1099-18]|uniref:Beta-mannosidase B n=1 Tax=Sporothrix schenckii 1099-18 TaxID=1397361 RepID=A0A0F2MB97_SPOSC|nr:beta-mannosidase [Sporothrix schenckii 1099-18]KJR86095.1 beta-mannosidase [Sporothrix schenckii 1099-18]